MAEREKIVVSVVSGIKTVQHAVFKTPVFLRPHGSLGPVFYEI